MNIKGVNNNKVFEIERLKEKKSEQSSDRDPNGQYFSDEQKKKKFTEEEVVKIVKKIESLEGIKVNHLKVRFEKSNEIFVIYVEDMTGKRVRRIPESDFYQFLGQDESKTSGHILNKAL